MATENEKAQYPHHEDDSSGSAEIDGHDKARTESIPDGSGSDQHEDTDEDTASGGAESLATQPITTTHHGLAAEERTRRGITDSMIRLSIGLEDTADLIADLTQDLEGVEK